MNFLTRAAPAASAVAEAVPLAGTGLGVTGVPGGRLAVAGDHPCLGDALDSPSLDRFDRPVFARLEVRQPLGSPVDLGDPLRLGGLGGAGDGHDLPGGMTVMTPVLAPPEQAVVVVAGRRLEETVGARRVLVDLHLQGDLLGLRRRGAAELGLLSRGELAHEDVVGVRDDRLVLDPCPGLVVPLPVGRGDLVPGLDTSLAGLDLLGIGLDDRGRLAGTVAHHGDGG